METLQEDIKEFDIGDNFMVLYTSSNKYYARGSNEKGQCGVGKKDSFFDSWVHIDVLNEREPTHLKCGLNHVDPANPDHRDRRH